MYGNPREVHPIPYSTKMSNPQVIPNEKYILVDSATDRRNKISSQATRPHAKAPSVTSMRREGTHNVLYKALLKKQTYK